MGEIEKTIQKILEVDDSLSKKVEEAKLEARRILESAKAEIENYRGQKEKELQELKTSLEIKFNQEIEDYRNKVLSKLEVDKSALLEILRSRREEVVDKISSEVLKEIIGSILSK